MSTKSMDREEIITQRTRTLKLLLIITFLLVFFTIIPPVKVLAGCFPRRDIESVVQVTPDIPCLKVRVESDCIGVMTLDIRNSCNDTFVYDQYYGNRTVEIVNYETWVKLYRVSPEVEYSISDEGIPQDYTSWVRKLYYKQDPSKEI